MSEGITNQEGGTVLEKQVGEDGPAKGLPRRRVVHQTRVSELRMPKKSGGCH